MNKRSIATFILIAWCVILVKVLVFKDLPVIRHRVMIFHFGGTQTGPPNLVPFKSILPYLLLKRGLMISAINILGNIAAFVPLGFLAAIINRKLSWRRVFVLAIGSGLCIEIMQVVFRVGIFDVDDLILNGLGVIIGYGMIRPWLRGTYAEQPATSETLSVMKEN